MTEAGWLRCATPGLMLEYLHAAASARKRRLFACACCRRTLDVFPSRQAREAIETGERYADGAAGAEELAAALEAVERSRADEYGWPAGRGLMVKEEWVASRALRALAQAAGKRLPEMKAVMVAAEEAVILGRVTTLHDERSAQCDLLRDLFGNPFRPVGIDPAWLTRGGGAVRKLAKRIYIGRRFADLPALADALEDAGCTGNAVLDHCRRPGGHVLGCWCLDLLLGQR